MHTKIFSDEDTFTLHCNVLHHPSDIVTILKTGWCCPGHISRPPKGLLFMAPHILLTYFAPADMTSRVKANRS